ncbi:MAG TPA: helix-turn-helix transcriptional regulator, partial [Bacilli bacterium]|nr:helix-turn-helix transcriptional regulator [Bacilli bacterium]
MPKLNELFQELGISKVRLAKYLGVSRQMVYNYLDLKDVNKWPKEKKLLLFKLLDIDDAEASDIEDIKVTTD